LVRRKGAGQEAFKRATAARAKMLELIDEKPYLYNETAKRFAATQIKLSQRE